MHELSLCRAIADTVREHADGRPVASVAIQVGHLRQVVPTTLEFCWGLAIEGTDLAACRLEIDHVPGMAHCRTCNADTALEKPVLLCGSCGGRDVALVSGEEFLVASIEVGAVA